jgi:hypothetical protein
MTGRLPRPTASVAHAELVALGVGHHQPAVAVFVAGTGLETAGAETLQADSLALVTRSSQG